MAQIYTKDNKGTYTKLGDVSSLEKVQNIINSEDLDKYIKQYWTKEKSGKHPELSKKHKAILLQDLLVKPEDYFEQINKNIFTFQNFGPIKLSQFLTKAHLEEYLNKEYIKHSLEVTTYQPALGKGEFLLVSCFKNINFANESGDLIDTDGNRIEVKGNHASIGGTKNFKSMNKSIMFSIYRLFNNNLDYNDLTMDCAKELDVLIQDNPSKCKEIMLLLQNNEKESNTLANEMVELYNEIGNLLQVIASAHLYAYLKIQKANFLFSINDTLFAGFKAPQNIKQSYEIIKHFNINGWTTGNKGITFTLKKE